MRFLLMASLVLWHCTATIAGAGAWLREEGTGFVSLSFGGTETRATTNGLYLEYGLSDKTTIGLDVSAFTNNLGVRNGIGNVFIRRGFGPTNRPSRWAYEIGVGGIWGNEMQLPTFKTQVSWGRGFQLGGKSGWMNIDAAYIHEPTTLSHISKLDGTIGMDFSAIATGILEINLSQQNNDTFGAIEPSILIKPKITKLKFKFGAQIPLDPKDHIAFKLGIWRDF